MTDTALAPATVRPVQGYYARPSVTFDRVGPLVQARTLTRVHALLDAAMQRSASGKAILLARVEVLEGPLKGRLAVAAFTRDDLTPATPRDPAVEAFRRRFDAIVARSATPPDGEDGLVVDGRIVAVPGLEVLSFLRHPQLVPRVKDGKLRPEPVLSFVVHTVHGKVGDVLEAPAPASSRAERYARYQATTDRDVSWHLTLDTDRTLLVSADLARWMCWHAPPTNNWSIGMELVQEESGRLYGPQLDAAVVVIAQCCDLFGIPRRVPVDAAGRPFGGDVKAWQPRVEGGRSERWRGVVGHRNLTTSRGLGDAGDAIMHRLLAAGFLGYTVPI